MMMPWNRIWTSTRSVGAGAEPSLGREPPDPRKQTFATVNSKRGGRLARETAGGWLFCDERQTLL